MLTIALLLSSRAMVNAQELAILVDSIEASQYDFSEHFFDTRIVNNSTFTVWLPVEQFDDQSSIFMQYWFCCTGIGIDSLDFELDSLRNEKIGTVTMSYTGNVDSMEMSRRYHDSLRNEVNSKIPKQIHKGILCYKLLPHKQIKLRVMCTFLYYALESIKKIDEKNFKKMDMMFILPVKYYSNNKLQETTLISEPDEKIKQYFSSLK